MNKKILLILLIIIIILGCKKLTKDPLLGLKIGSSESVWNEKLDVLVNRGTLTKAKFSNFYFGYILDSIYVRIQPNTEFEQGKLLNYRIGFLKENQTKYYIDIQYFPYMSEYTLTSKVLKELIQLYGRPDSLIQSKDINKMFERFKGEPLIDSLIGNFKAKWILNKFNILFNVGGLSYIQDTLSKNWIPSDNFDCYLEYQHPDYNREIKEITDSIISKYTISDYIVSELDDPVIRKVEYPYSIHEREISFNLIKFTRLENLDSRAIESLLADVVLLDNFENELAKFIDIEFDFGDHKLVTLKYQQRKILGESIESRISRLKYETNALLIFNKSYNYNSEASTLELLELAFQKGTRIKSRLNIKAIKFDDSKILKSEIQ
jgi:hypothetical protein